MKKILFFFTVAIFLISCEGENIGEYQCDNTSPNRIGAICDDGTRSNSVGSGTCSGHGGVDYWICED
jgi:hypothetical protein